MALDSEKQAREAAMEQLRFRGANDRLRRIVTSYRFEAEDRVPFICECADASCFESLMLSLEEYDRVRAHPSWFLLAAGHEDEDAEHQRTVEAQAERGFSIVEFGVVEAAARPSG